MKNLNKIVRETFEKGNYVMSIEEVKEISKKVTTIRISGKFYRHIESLPNYKIELIDSDILRGRETIYRIAHGLNRQYYNRAASNIGRTLPQGDGVVLNSTILRSLSHYGGDNSRYIRIINLLIGEGLVEMTKDYSKGHSSRVYRYTDNTVNSKLISYKLKHEDSIIINNKHILNRLRKIQDNPIAITAYYNRFKVDMPSEEEVTKHLNEAVKNKYRNNKGKLLKRIGKNSRERFKGDYVFVEDYLEMYKALRDNNYIPIIGDNRSGGRIVTAFTLMPSIIRNLIKINGETLVEADYSCMHPNMMATIHDMEARDPVTHEGVARYINTDFDKASKAEQKEMIKSVKIQHLQYFNMKAYLMEHLAVHKYYKETHTAIIEAVQANKKINGYKDTSQRLFTLEVAIMTQVQKELLEKGIDAIYVYDCYMVEPKNIEATREIMQRVAKEFGTNLKVGN